MAVSDLSPLLYELLEVGFAKPWAAWPALVPPQGRPPVNAE